MMMSWNAGAGNPMRTGLSAHVIGQILREVYSTVHPYKNADHIAE